MKFHSTRSGLFAGLILAATFILSSTAFSAPLYTTLLESNADQPGGSEVFVINYNTFANFTSNTQASSNFSALDVNPNFSIGGFTYDGKYRLLVESNLDQTGGTEVFLITYDNLAALNSGTSSSSGFSTVDVNPNFSIGGLAYDGQYRLLLENNADVAGGSELFLITYNTFADLISNNQASSGFLALDVNPNFGVAGLEFDGQYRLVLESNADQPSGSEIFTISYSSFANLLSNTQSASGFSALDVNHLFGMGDIAYQFETSSTVDEPATLALFLTMLSGLAFFRRRR